MSIWRREIAFCPVGHFWANLYTEILYVHAVDVVVRHHTKQAKTHVVNTVDNIIQTARRWRPAAATAAAAAVSDVIVWNVKSRFIRWLHEMKILRDFIKQESPAVADKPARRLRKVCTVYVRAVRL